MINKKFENKDTGQKVVIRSDDGTWFTLDNGSKIKRESFFMKYTEILDPNSFFNNQKDIENLANKIKTVNTDNIQDITQEPNIKKIDESNLYSENNMANKIDQKQKMINDFLEKERLKNQELKQYKQLNDDEAAEQLLKNVNPTINTNEKNNNPNFPEFDANIKRDKDNKINDQQNQQNQEKIQNETEIETYKFFKGFKRNHKITIELKFDGIIADPDFLKLMMNNFEADVIKYYTMEIHQNILNNTKKVEDDIYKQLENIILGKKQITRKPRKTTKSTTKSTTTKLTTKSTTTTDKNNENNKITTEK